MSFFIVVVVVDFVENLARDDLTFRDERKNKSCRSSRRGGSGGGGGGGGWGTREVVADSSIFFIDCGRLRVFGL